MTEKTSKQLNIIKFLSIFSVICAHCNTVAPGASSINVTASYLLNAVGTIGVGAFFAVSGYLFTKSNKYKKLSILIRVKGERLLLPWIFCGTLVWLYVVLRKGGISFVSWLKFLLGYESYLYFVPVLFVLYCVFWLIDKNIVLTVMGMVLSLLSNVLTCMHFLPVRTAAVNAMNWYLFFALGSLAALGKLKSVVALEIVSAAASICSMIAFGVFHYGLSYWDKYYLLFAFLSLGGMIGISDFIADRAGARGYQMIEKTAGWTMGIYLLHMPIAGIIANICGRVDCWWLTLMRPFLVLVITVIILSCYRRIVNRLSAKTWMMKMVGID